MRKLTVILFVFLSLGVRVFATSPHAAEEGLGILEGCRPFGNII